MRLLATLIIALRALKRNKLRSILTALGIIIGVGAVIAVVSIGNGAKTQIEAQIAGLGQNIITVFPGSFTSGGSRGGSGSMSTLTPDDADAIRREIPGVVAVSSSIRDRQQVIANGLNWNTTINGESPDIVSVRSWEMQSGAFFTDADVRSTAKVAVIGKTAVDQLFPGEDPVGQTLRIRNLPFKIVGVLKPKGFNFFGSDQDDVVMIPYTSAMRRVTKRTNLSSIYIQSVTPEMMSTIQDEVTALLQQRRAGREPDFTVRNQQELAETATKQSETMTLLLSIIAGVSLLVGGIGIMNIMLVSVTERTREIGIRLAIGAHDSDIRLQFLIEAISLSLIGGILGILSGIGLSQLVAARFSMPVEISILSIVLAFGFSALVGILFGFYPAYKASQLDPIDALRFE